MINEAYEDLTNLSLLDFDKKSVLIIETDIRVPKVLEYFGMNKEARKGLSDFIVDKSIEPQDMVLKHKENPFLDIIPAGTIPPNPSELLMSDRIDELFAYSVIILISVISIAGFL